MSDPEPILTRHDHNMQQFVADLVEAEVVKNLRARGYFVVRRAAEGDEWVDDLGDGMIQLDGYFEHYQ